MFNFKKLLALGASTLMIGLTMGTAAAANYPAPFVVGGSADAAIVYGTGAGVSPLDLVQAGNLQSNLQSYMGAVASGSTTSTSGEVVSLDTSNTRIYINTSLNTARASITKSNLPTVLADQTFSGNVDAKMTQQIDLFAGVAAGGDNSGKVIFAKQPESNVDPVMGISMAGVGANQLYNATATFKAVAFNHSDSEGETITLFGKDFVVSTATDATDLVLFSSAEEVSLSVGGTNPSSTTVNIEGTDYLIELVTGSGTTSASVSVDGTMKPISAGNSKKIGGIEVAVKSVTESTALDKLDATLLIGSQKLTFTHGATVTVGSDSDPISGTRAYLTSSDTDGRPSALTALTVAVFKAGGNEDAIVMGESFVDPVFGSFKIDFAGLSSALDDETRDTIQILPAGDDSVSLSFTDVDSYEFSLDFAHNVSSQWKLGDDSNNTIHVMEMSNISEDEYIAVGNEDYGHVLQLTDIYNSSNGDHTKHRAKFRDVASDTTYETTFTSDATGTVIVDGKTYTVTMNDAAGGTHKVQLKYPTSDSTATTGFIVYPTMQTQRGANLAMYAPLTINLGTYGSAGTTVAAGSKTLHFPDGNGYTDVALEFVAGDNWTIGGESMATNDSIFTDDWAVFTIGQLRYNMTGAGQSNLTILYVTDPEGGGSTGGDNIDQPGLIMFEEQDTKNVYEALVVDLESDPKGDSNDGVGVNDVLFTTPNGHYGLTLASNSDITQDVDYYGVLTTIHAGDSDQKSIIISYPDTQVYANIYVGELDSVVTSTGGSASASSLGEVIVKDSEVSSVSSKNLIIVGGSCINSAAATVLGSGCGTSFTTTTGVGVNQFLIESFGDKFSTGKIALVVAGYEQADTVNAATYLRTKLVDTAAGKKYIGTSATSAELQVA
jgi:hypothetical protein